LFNTRYDFIIIIIIIFIFYFFFEKFAQPITSQDFSSTIKKKRLNYKSVLNQRMNFNKL